MNATRPRAIFDCNVLFQAFLTRRGPSSECIRLVEVGRVQLVTSLDALSEARDVLSRPFVLERAPHVTPASIDSFLKDLAYRANLWRTVPHYIDYERDPDDEPYLDLAIAAAADYLVTRDRDLLIPANGPLGCGQTASSTDPKPVTGP
jgi:putative PIN family toxin of toxin-antitoxin system